MDKVRELISKMKNEKPVRTPGLMLKMVKSAGETGTNMTTEHIHLVGVISAEKELPG